MAVPVRHELLAWVDGQGARLSQSVSQALSARGQRLRDVARALPRVNTLVEAPRQKLDYMSDRLPAGLSRLVQVKRISLSDVAGSLRPSALRNRVVSERRRLDGVSPRLDPALTRTVQMRSERLAQVTPRLRVEVVHRDIAQKIRDLDAVAQRLSAVGSGQIKSMRDQLSALDRLRETLGYKATLQRGYAVVRANGALVTTASKAKAADVLDIEFADGRVTTGTSGAASTPKKPAKSNPTSDQGSLF